ncbi:hypothetical protein GSI_02594 [Ganoderma sinense ZZ0214-1]|uniref:Uncharacterized protein n=1 Tax=Ganoderma sinense ZZ0214-1 TaxID=1077348 RepID=A0A2G8SM00_9APHY|nr:hypothetical protein GSI_02594 [Ganoderma sinense ZZ0214-1]
MSEATPDARRLLELAVRGVLRQTDPNLFIQDNPMDAVDLSDDPVIKLKKTGGTTRHRRQANNYISYTLNIPSLTDRGYSIYVTRVSTNPAVNREALARAIQWFVVNYYNATTYMHDEPAT